ncbi:MAG: hypothetical protein ACXWIN_08315 [Burkholderiaceae bacterium]
MDIQSKDVNVCLSVVALTHAEKWIAQELLFVVDVGFAGKTSAQI